MAQTVYPDAYDEPLSDALVYIENDGQLVADEQWQADAIDVYSWGAPGTMYFATQKYFLSAMKFSPTDTTPDTLHRLDFAFTNAANQVAPVILTPADVNLRYYNQLGTFDRIDVGKRVAYDDIYNNIDVHFYSNEFGHKSSVVFENGADPAVFELTVEGYDAITEVQDYLIIHKAGLDHVIPAGVAYEVDAVGNVNVLPWQPSYTHDGLGHLTFSNLGTWNSSKTLIFQFCFQGNSRDEDPEFVDWCTLFGGGTNETYVFDLKTDNTGNLYAGGTSSSSTFPISNTDLQNDFEGLRDMIFAKFDINHALVWATFIGGSELDGGSDPFRFDLNSSQSLLIASETKSTDFPTLNPGNGAYYDDVNTCPVFGPCDDGVIIEISSSGSLVYSTYFGLSGNGDRLRSIVVDANDNFFIVGTCSGPSQNPGGGAYFSAVGSGRVMKFNASRAIQWSTAFSGGSTQIFDCALNPSGDLLITGFTGDYINYPIQNLTGAYNQPTSNGGSFEAFVAQFDATDYSLTWSTFLGGGGSDKAWDIDVSKDNEVIISGHTLSSTGMPVETPGTGFYQASYGGTGTVGLNRGDGFLARFDSGRDLDFLTYVGDNSSDELRDATFHHNYILATGITASAANFPFPGTNPTDMYVDNTHNESNDHHYDGHVMALRNSDLEHYWTTYVGSFGSAQPYSQVGPAEDELFALEPYGLDKLYIGGAVFSDQDVPFQNPGGNAWFQSSHNANAEGFICLFDLADSPLDVAEVDEEAFRVYPNPATDRLRIDGLQDQGNTVSVFDLVGRVIISDMFVQEGIDISQLQSGSYLLQVNTPTGTQTSVFQKL